MSPVEEAAEASTEASDAVVSPPRTHGIRTHGTRAPAHAHAREALLSHTGTVPATFMVVPQWQGSMSARAMRLSDGAQAILGDLPASATRVVDVPVGAGESLESGVLRYSSILRVRDRMLDEFTGITGQTVVIGGDCAVSLAAVEHAISTQGDDVAVVWFDAHPDLNTPTSSPSGAFGGMVLRTLLGDGPDGLVPRDGGRVHPERLVLCGIRDIDPAEARFIDETGITALTVDELTPESLAAAVLRTGAAHVYVHIDLDVLDPSTLLGLDYPEPFGIDLDLLTRLIAAVREHAAIAGATIAGFAPATPSDAGDDLPAILRIIGSLTRA
jgi:arginase